MKWNEILDLIKSSANTVTLEQNGALSPDALHEMGIPETSTLGQVMLNVKRFVVNGYLRVLGADMPEISNKVNRVYPGNKIVVATDIWGGLFAISNGDFYGDTSVIWYYAPDTLQWESTNIDYPRFITWVLSKNFNQFYSSFLWSNIKDTLKNISDDQVVLIYPFLWANECDLETATKQIVPFDELLQVNAEYQRKLYNS